MKKLAIDSSSADLAFAAVWAGSIGGSAVALFFLLLDVVGGHVLQTPSILSSAVFRGEIPTGEHLLLLELVALYSLVHFVVFTAVGAAFAWIVAHTVDVAGQSLIVSAGLFATLMAGVLAVDLFRAPGLAEAIGLIPLCVGNALATGAMFTFYRSVLGAPTGEAIPHV